MTDSRPEINLRQMSFPSDRLTIQAIRKAHPRLFAQERPNLFDEPTPALRQDSIRLADGVSTILYLERLLARMAFDAVLNRPEPDVNRDAAIRMLSLSYKHYGLASGIKSTTELVRGIETAAAAQARVALGQGRG